MRCARTSTALILSLLSLTVIAGAQNQPLAFEVASVKRNINGTRCPDQFNASRVNFCDANLAS